MIQFAQLLNGRLYNSYFKGVLGRVDSISNLKTHFSKETMKMTFTATWMDLEILILSGVSQTEKDKYHMTSLTCEI